MKRVGIDLDGTTSSPYCWLKLFNKLTNKKFTPKDITNYDIHETFGQDNLWDIIMEDYAEEYFDAVDIRPHAVDVINRLIELKIIDPHFITARSDTDYIRYRTEMYLQDNNLMLIPLHMLSSHDKVSKAIELGLDIMIDDRGETCLEMAQNGIKVCMMDTYYNKEFSHPNIFRCRDWLDVYRIVLELQYYG